MRVQKFIIPPTLTMEVNEETTAPVSTQNEQSPIISNGQALESPQPLHKKVKVESREVSVDIEGEGPTHEGPPVHEVVGGSSIRQYLNQHLTKHVLDGLKEVSTTKPEDPLTALGEFLLRRAKEVKEVEEVKAEKEEKDV